MTPSLPVRLLALTTGFLLLAACGEPAGSSAPDPEEIGGMVERLQELWGTEEEEERTRVLEAIGKLAREHPDVVIPDLVERLRTERANPNFGFIQLELDYTDSKLTVEQQKADALKNRNIIFARLQRHLPAREAQGDFTNVSGRNRKAHLSLSVARLTKDDAIEAEKLSFLLDVTTRPGRLDLSPVVERPGEEKGEAKSLWDGTAETYDAFVEKYHAELAAAVEGGDYTPRGERGFQMVWRPPAEKGGATRSLMVYRPAERAKRFTQEDIRVEKRFHKPTGKLVLELAVSADRRPAMDAWLAEHQGRSLAVLVDYRTEFVMQAPRDAEQLRYTALGSSKAAAGTLERIVKAIQPGSLTRPINGHITPSDPVSLDTPIAMALVMVGPAAKPALEALFKEGGSLGRRALFIRTQIERRQRQGPG